MLKKKFHSLLFQFLTFFIFYLCFKNSFAYCVTFAEVLSFLVQESVHVQGLGLDYDAMSSEMNGELYPDVDESGSDQEIRPDMLKIVANTNDEMSSEMNGELYADIDLSPREVDTNTPRNLGCFDYDPGIEIGDEHLTPEIVFHIENPLVEKRGLHLFYNFIFPTVIVGGAGLTCGFAAPVIFFSTMGVSAISWGVNEILADNYTFRINQAVLPRTIEAQALLPSTVDVQAPNQLQLPEVPNNQIGLPIYDCYRPNSSISGAPLPESLRQIVP